MTQQTQPLSERVALPDPPESTPRLRLKPKGVRTGHVDGAWWPHSHDLQTELPDLLAVLAVRLGTIHTVKYDTHGWSTSPRLADTQHRSVMMSGSQFQPANTLHVVGINRKQLVLLVVPPAHGSGRRAFHHDERRRPGQCQHYG